MYILKPSIMVEKAIVDNMSLHVEVHVEGKFIPSGPQYTNSWSLASQNQLE